jgi:osmotically-inducible protein OsmY
MATATNNRPASDIEEDIRDLIRSYDPLKQARPFLDFHVEDGKVTLSGHVRSMQARRVFVDNVPDIPGVKKMDDKKLYDDETLRLDIGKVLPRGVRVRVNYGAVTIAGQLPADASAEDIIRAVKGVLGVRADRVMSELY